MRAVRAAEPNELTDLARTFKDDRLKTLLPLYKARNYPRSLNDEERTAWDKFCRAKLLQGGMKSSLSQYFSRLEELMTGTMDDHKRYLLEELQLYGESIVPADADG